MTDEPAPWPAPHANGAVRARVELPGSKSITNRLLVLAALADGPSRIIAPLRARDSVLMVTALTELGTQIADDGTDWVVTPGDLHGAVIDTGLAGTVMRFVPPAAALATGAVTFDGDDYARERPMWTLIDGLRQAGATIDDAGRGRLPFTLRASGTVTGGTVHIDTSASSQFVSGLLLAGARYDKGIEVVHTGRGVVPSAPHIEMTLANLRAAGVAAAQTGPATWQVAPGPIAGRTVVVEPDLSNAAPFLAAALVTAGEVRIPNWPAVTTQAGDAIRDLLARMGADVSLTGDELTVRGTATIAGINADLHEVTELATVVAALAALAEGPSELSGLAHTRGHETDRLAALAREINGLGGDVVETEDSLIISPRPLHGGRWKVYADHRMATAGALLGLAVEGIEIDDIGATTKTLPDFPGMWTDLLTG